MEEIWKDIEEVNGLYQVSNKGWFRGKARTIKDSNGKTKLYKEKYLKPFNDGTNTLSIVFTINRKRFVFKASHIVAKYFLEGYNDNIGVIFYKDNNTQNIAVNNLKLPNVYTKQVSYKVDDDIVTAIRKKYDTGGFTMQDLANQYNISLSYVSRIINKHRKTTV